MTIGDPKKAAVLAIVAVVVSGVAVFRVLPKAEHAMSQLLAPDQKPTVVAEQLDYPQGLSTDPFGHPLLAKGGSEAPKPPPSDTPNSGGRIGFQPMPLGGDLPKIEPPPGGQPKPQPEENTGEDRQLRVESEIRLAAIMSVDQPMALLQGSNDATGSFGIGATAFGFAKVVSIGESKVVLKIKGRRVELAVGESVKE